MRLLLVEDDLMIGEDLQKALRKGGIVVNWVQDAETAQLTLKLETYDLIILDLGLPGKSGLELLGQIRTNGDDIPVLILTARDALSDKVKGFDTGADDYLLKPFALEELEARIRSLMRRRMGQAGNENGLLRHEQISLNPKTHEVFFNGSKIILSAKEFSLLHTLLKNAECYPFQVTAGRKPVWLERRNCQQCHRGSHFPNSQKDAPGCHQDHPTCRLYTRE